MKHLLHEDGSFSFIDAWKLKQKMFPKKTSNLSNIEFKFSDKLSLKNNLILLIYTS